jgi:DNA-binding CsgD family transcriptional regulator
VGRAAELRVLNDLLAGTGAGALVTALVCGEAGSGKTRLVTEVAGAAQAGGMRTLVGSCMMVGSTSLAFAPFAEALRPVVQGLAADPTGHAGSPAPRLARLVAGPVGAAAAPEPPGIDPLGAFAQLGLFEEVLDTLERAAVPSGLLVVIEDLHWADLSSRGLFEFLSRNLRGPPIALVGTVRTDEPDDAGFLAWLAEVQRGPRILRIDLEPFDRDELAELLAGVLGHGLSDEEASSVHERSGGNAFLAEELIAAGKQGVLVPSTVQGVVLAHVAGLTAPARGLVRLAAVAGVRVSHGLLAAAAGLADEALLTAARELTERHLLVAERTGYEYAFRHALTREAVYQDLLPGERQQLHRALARALTDDPGLGPPAASAVAQAVAEHWLAAGELERALPASVAAGHAARSVAALRDALGHYERALELWDRVADPETVAGFGRSAVLEPAAETASGAGEHERAIRYVDAAIDELEHNTTAPAQLPLLYAQKYVYLLRAGREAELLEWTERAAALVPSEPPSRGSAAVLAARAHALCSAERFEEASQVAAAALYAARCSGARRQEGLARTALGGCLVMTGADPEAGIRELEQAIAICRELSDIEGIDLGYSYLTDTFIRLGRLDEAAATALEAADVCLELGALQSWLGIVMINGAEALFLAGRWDECQELLTRLRDQHCGGFVEHLEVVFTALLEATRGRNDAAVAAIDAAGSAGIEDTQAEALLSAARAQLALNTGNLEAAHQAAVEGLDTLTGSPSLPEVLAIVTLSDLALRIEADRAQVARARRDLIGEHGAVDSSRTVSARTLAVRTRACPAVRRPEVLGAHRALCDAEVGRAEGQLDPDGWHRVATASAFEGGPHQVAYAGFREAEALLASGGDRARAIDALTAVHKAAKQLAAEPLRHEIEALARRARIELSDGPSPPLPLPAEPGLAPLGLTARELEVLGLLAAGCTNPQIGEALYISRKTASHHVSSVLTKLGVTSRIQAAGVAHRLGLTPDSTAPK